MCALPLLPLSWSQVRDDVIKQLRLRSPAVLLSSFNRPNIHYQVLFPDLAPAPAAALGVGEGGGDDDDGDDGGFGGGGGGEGGKFPLLLRALKKAAAACKGMGTGRGWV